MSTPAASKSTIRDSWWRSFERAWTSEAPKLLKNGRNRTCSLFCEMLDKVWILSVPLYDEVDDASLVCRTILESKGLRSILRRWPGGKDGLLRVVLFAPNPDYGPILLWSRITPAFVVGEGDIVQTRAPAYFHGKRDGRALPLPP